MSKMNFSTIGNPEFVNLQPLEINPLMSKCEIKVLYIGKNRNGSYINKEAATEMAKSLRGAPIVGYYNDAVGDYRDHGEQVTLNGDGINFECLTKPYGFVSPDAQVWFQDFEEETEFGDLVIHTYLMTTGYLWTGQYEEAKLAIEEGRPQSMELDEDSLDGHWAEDPKSEMSFFIINDAIFSKLCILGEDVEPCFEGAAVSAPDVSTSFTLDKNFTTTLYTMMQELQTVLKGGKEMDKNDVITENQTEEVTEPTEYGTTVMPHPADDEPIEETSSEGEGTSAVTFTSEKDEGETEDTETPEETVVDAYEKKDDEEDKEDANEDESSEDSDEEDKDDDEEDEKKKYELLQAEHENLQKQFSELKSLCDELTAFKQQVDNEKKDALINQFYMLSDEDKADVVANKTKYSLDDIEAKLSIIYTKKQLAAAELAQTEETDMLTYAFNGTESDSTLPDWIKAVQDTQKSL